MRQRSSETVAQRRRRILAEAQELVDDHAVRCDLCQERMRYWPSGAKTKVRAAGRYFSWRCDGCFFACEVVAAALAGDPFSPVQLWHGRMAQAQALTEHFAELAAEPPSELAAAALERLGLQLQAVAEQLEAAAAAIARGRGIVLYSDARHSQGARSFAYVPWTPHPPAPAQA